MNCIESSIDIAVPFFIGANASLSGAKLYAFDNFVSTQSGVPAYVLIEHTTRKNWGEGVSIIF